MSNGAAEAANPERADPSREHVLAWSLLALIVAIGAARLTCRIALSVEASYDLTDVLQHVAFCGVLAFFAIYLSRDAPEGWRRRLLLVKPRISSGGLLVILLSNWAVLSLGIPLSMLGEYIGGPDESSRDYVADFENVSPGFKIAAILAWALGPGIAEELLFRSYLQGGLLKAFRPVIALLISALLFSAWHLPGSRGLSLFPFGLWMGFITYRTGSVWLSMICHVLVSFSALILSATGADPIVVGGAIIIIGAPSFVLALRALRRAAVTPGATP